jgi:hypothetical protein
MFNLCINVSKTFIKLKKNGVNLNIKYKKLSKLNRRQLLCVPIRAIPRKSFFLTL